ncbi:biogenesis of lysosome-related organelles complex 1 subunit 4-like [Pomacea canaliculata]|nr:biogenesis of lysosome-related organelles complex 1 subunit 4-like [Pomacea canaliculata]
MEQRSSSEVSLASSNSSDVEAKSTHVLLEELTRDYSYYLNFDISKEQGKFSESIESMLTKLEEFCGLVDMIRSDTSLCLTKTMPEIEAKCKEMNDIFTHIDHLEAFVSVVKKDVSAMEESVSKAESELSTSSLMQRLSTFMSRKPSSDVRRPQQKPQFNPPHIFHTEKYINTSLDIGSSADTNVSSSTTATGDIDASYVENADTSSTDTKVKPEEGSS